MEGPIWEEVRIKERVRFPEINDEDLHLPTHDCYQKRKIKRRLRRTGGW